MTDHPQPEDVHGYDQHLDSLSALGVDPRADSRNGEYVIVKPPGWSQARWDAYQRGLGGAPR